jgi:hypothetical protein
MSGAIPQAPHMPSWHASLPLDAGSMLL